MSSVAPLRPSDISLIDGQRRIAKSDRRAAGEGPMRQRRAAIVHQGAKLGIRVKDVGHRGRRERAVVRIADQVEARIADRSAAQVLLAAADRVLGHDRVPQRHAARAAGDAAARPSWRC